MSTFADIILDVQSTLDDEDGTFHTDANVQTYLEHGELFLSLSRFLVEKTVTFPLLANVPEYNMLDTYPDWCWPLRVTIANFPVTEIKLDTVARVRPAWRTQRGTPENYIRLGHTMLAFVKPPSANMNAAITYLACPPTTLSTPPAGVSPVIQDMWHAEIMAYGQLLGTAKEGQLQRTQDILKSIAENAGNKRDVRFLRDSTQRNAPSRHEAPLSKEDERP